MEGKKVNENELNGMRSEAKHYCEVISSFKFYATDSFQEVELSEDRWNRVDKLLRNLIPEMEEKWENWKNCIIKNQEFFRLITSNEQIFHTSSYINYTFMQNEADKYPPAQRNRSKVRSTLKQCMRDWSDEGRKERENCYSYLLKEVDMLYPKNKVDRGNIRILVPGSGMGRLPWEFAAAGFDSQGNEFSYHMLIASYLVLNCTRECLKYTIHPFIHEPTNVMNTKDHLRSVSVPDVDPSKLPETSTFSMTAGDFLEIYGAGRDRAMHADKTIMNADESHQLYAHADDFDCVVTCYFLDTANNVMEYIRCISHILKIGGYWINFGPLLYHFADSPNEMSIELSYEQIKKCFKIMGLKLIKERTHISSVYASNPKSMQHTVYDCVFFTCVKEHNPKI